MRKSELNLPLLPLVLDDVPFELRELLVQEGVPFDDRSRHPLAGRFVLFDSRRGQPESVDSAQAWIDVDDLRDGSDRRLLDLLADRRSKRHEWRIDGITLCEEIAGTDRRAVRRQIVAGLRARLEPAGGIWLGLSPYPFPCRSVFNLRIDYDLYDAGDFDSLMEAIAGHEGATSHFVNGATYESVDRAWPRLRELDVGSHGYRHHTYRTVEENLRNIGRGIEVIRARGIEPRGFAAPHGRFCAELDQAMSELSISHSGEFALACDEQPFCATSRSPLQIPVHPVCLGLFLDAADAEMGPASAREARRRAAVSAATDYYLEWIAGRHRSAEPMVLYGHPTGRLGRYPALLRAVLAKVEPMGSVWKTTQTEWAAWWNARRRFRFKVTEEQGQYLVTVLKRPSRARFGLEFWREDHVALMALDKPTVRFSPEGLAYESRRSQRNVRPVRIDRPEGLKAHLRRAIDWERVTPLEEIGTVGWRNRVKRTLRRWMRP
jgi:hypothetical protein